MANPFLERVAKRGTSAHGLKSEKQVLKGRAKRQPGSGALPGAKGDGVADEFLYECKSTVRDSFGLQMTVLKKITEHALAMNRMPVVTITFCRPDGYPRGNDAQWALIPLKLFDELAKK